MTEETQKEHARLEENEKRKLFHDVIVLNKPITLQRPAWKDRDQIVHPEETIVKEKQMKIQFVQDKDKMTLFAKFEDVPTPILLGKGEDIRALGETWTAQQARDLLFKQIGDRDLQEFLQMGFPETPESDPDGVGAILSGMLSQIGINSSPNCSCRKRAVIMNKKGPQWCRDNKGEILDWLENEATKRKLAFVRSVANIMVEKAIKKSERLKAKKKKIQEQKNE